MSDYKVTDSELTGIANAIRTKGGTSSQLVFPDGFTSAIGAIPTGGGTIQQLSVNANGTYTPPSGVDGYAPVVVSVSGGGGRACHMLTVEPSSSLGSVGDVAILYDLQGGNIMFEKAYLKVPQGWMEITYASASMIVLASDSVLYGLSNPDNSIGSNGDVYVKYYIDNVENMFGTPSSNSPYDGSISCLPVAVLTNHEAYQGFGENTLGWGRVGTSGGTDTYLQYVFSAKRYLPKKLSINTYFTVTEGYLGSAETVLQASNDGSLWDDLLTVNSSGTFNIVGVDKYYSHFRFSITGSFAGIYAGLKNIVLMGTKEGTTTGNPILLATYLKDNGNWVPVS